MSQLTPRTMDIKLMDRQYKVNCPAGQEAALQRAADRLNEKLEQIRSATRLSHPEQIAVMAALNLCHEATQYADAQDEKVRDLEEKIKLLQDTLEQVMAEQRPGR